LNELKIDIMLNARLRFDVTHAAQNVSSGGMIGQHHRFAGNKRCRQTYDCALREHDYGAGILVYGRKILAEALCCTGRMHGNRNLDADSLIAARLPPCTACGIHNGD
jgi:hypothetical protein